MSTLLSELDSAPAQGDGDFVQNILNEMNGGSGPTNPPVQPPPAVGGLIKVLSTRQIQIRLLPDKWILDPQQRIWLVIANQLRQISHK